MFIKYFLLGILFLFSTLLPPSARLAAELDFYFLNYLVEDYFVKKYDPECSACDRSCYLHGKVAFAVSYNGENKTIYFCHDCFLNLRNIDLGDISDNLEKTGFEKSDVEKIIKTIEKMLNPEKKIENSKALV